MSKEQREVRPYPAADNLSRAFDGAELRFGDSSIGNGGRLSVNTNEYLRNGMVLSFARPGREELNEFLIAGIERLGLHASLFDVVLVLSSGPLKISDVAWSQSLEQFLKSPDDELAVSTKPARPRALQTPFGGCHADLFIVLSQNLKRTPLLPSRAGIWLARATFRIVTSLGEIGFVPVPLTSEMRDRYGLPQGVAFHTVVEEPLQAPFEPDSLLLLVDEELLSHLASSPASAESKALQRVLFLQVVTTLAYASSRDLDRQEHEVTLEEIEGSLAWNLVRSLSNSAPGGNDDRAQAVFRQLRHSPEKLLAEVQAGQSDLVRTLINGTAGGGARQ